MMRLKAAWNILRGRPTLFRIHIVDGTVVMGRHTMVVQCVTEGVGTAYQVWLKNNPWPEAPRDET